MQQPQPSPARAVNSQQCMQSSTEKQRGHQYHAQINKDSTQTRQGWTTHSIHQSAMHACQHSELAN